MPTPKIHALLERDPRKTELANKGQARISETPEAAQDEALRAELETFVCDGRFADGLARILDRFIADFGKNRQEAAWVSGFFGSGKSHLLKMLAHLWTDTRFRDGATARGLVPGGLPKDLRAAFAELDTRARRVGQPLFAAAGTLLSGAERVRAAVLEILLRARRLPTGIPQARFFFWLAEDGLLDRVRTEVGERGRPWEKELNNFHVSPRIADALLAADPDFSTGPKEVRTVLAARFPALSGDLTTEEFVALARKALAHGVGADGQDDNGNDNDDALPLTALVLDEAQQYIADSGERSSVFTEVAEAIQTRFDGRVMLVASGQSALSATPTLQKLRDRFRLKVELTDADVEQVTRQVLLRKKASAVEPIRKLFADREGEVSRHLRDTRFAAQPGDSDTRLDDYPLLSTRRRFWEACLRAVETREGTTVHSQLRSQLRILHDSLATVADRPLGAVIPASDLFHAIAPDLVSSGVLLNEIHTRINKLADDSREDRLNQNLAALVFLIGKLPREKGVDTGARADAATLADLLVTDLIEDSGPFRQRVEKALEELETDGVLMRVGTEYRLQTTEGAAWDAEFRQPAASVRNAAAALAAARDALFGEALQKILAGVRLRHGKAKERRNLVLHPGADPPLAGAEAVTVWLRDEWQCPEKEFDRQARSAGTDDPTLFVLLPKRDADDLKRRTAETLAAQRVLDHRGNPPSAEGREARSGMESRRDTAAEARDGIVRDLLRAARVLQGGGSEVFGDDLAARIARGAEASLARLHPRFDEGDGAHWGTAVKRAREKSDRPFAPLGWEQDAADHPVAKEVMTTVGPGARGTEIHRTLGAAPFGWPRDAIDAALLALVGAGRLRAERAGQPLAPESLDQAGVKTAVFRPEQVVLTVTQKLALRRLFQQADISVPSGNEAQGAAEFLRALRSLAAGAGGPSPLPEPPVSALVEDLARKAGNDQLLAIHEGREELDRRRQEWTTLAARAEPRRRQWALTARLRARAAGLPVLEEVGPELDSIRDRRSLLEDTDRLAPLTAKLAAALRTELTTLRAAFEEAVRRAETEMAADPTWAALDAGKQQTLRETHRLLPPPSLEIATDEALLRTLDDRPLETWRAITDAVPARTARALAEARDLAAPAKTEDRLTPVTLRRATLKDEAAVRSWLREAEAALLHEVTKGPIVVR